MNEMERTIQRQRPLVQLIHEGAEERFVGHVFRMTYDRAFVFTNDYWRQRVQGVPQNCILTAATFNPDQFDQEPPVSQFVMVLRVLGPASLPGEREAISAIIEHHQAKTDAAPRGPRDGIDAYTHAHLQYAALECRILGSLYENEDRELAFGADVEDYFSVAPLRVFKPCGNPLRRIVNYCDPTRVADARAAAERMGFANPPEPFEFGTVRYTSTNRLQHADGTDVGVSFETADILAKRCAIFGMTRTGKSNLIKTIVSEVAIKTISARGTVGQLILDINGEYANANQQDAGAISDVFSDHVIRYRTVSPPDGFLDLRPNFYRSYGLGLQWLQDALNEDGRLGGADIRNFGSLVIEDDEPTDYGQQKRWRFKVSAYRVLLDAAGYPKRSQDDFARFDIGQRVAARLYDELNLSSSAVDPNNRAKSNQRDKASAFKSEYGDPSTGIGLQEARRLFIAIRNVEAALRSANNNMGLESSSGGPWIDESVFSLLNLIAGVNRNGTPINSANVLARYIGRHSTEGSSNASADIHSYLAQGKIVIVDLSMSLQSERTDLMERIAAGIHSRNAELFIQGQTPPAILIYVEEAHNLLGRDADPDDTWPRIAKEGAKSNLGLIYATQEPSSVQTNIVANTENVLSSHLNNDPEIATLTKYYDFSDFSAGLKQAQDVGFVRLKRLSAPFVISAQVHIFEPSHVQQRYQQVTEANRQEAE